MTDKPQTLAEQIRALYKRACDVVHHDHDCPAIGGNGDYDCKCDAVPFLNDFCALADAAATTTPAEHFDDHAVRQFAKMMAAKMAASRAKGRSGWDDPNQCSVEHLQALLHEHVAKGDPVDVANICMMLRHYEASTTAPPAKQAGDVRQAVRVRLFIDDDGDICHEPRGAAMNLVAMAAIDPIDDRVMHPDLFKAMVDAYNAALEPDPTPALGCKAMRTRAAEAAKARADYWRETGETAKANKNPKEARDWQSMMLAGLFVKDAILALPGPTADQLLADAVRLPEVQAVVKCLDREKSLIWIIENTVQVLIRDLALEMLGQQRAALKAWRDGQRPPTEYEQKLAALKKDFPNGI